MLARVAESLYWIGRNIERCEHCSRYLKVQYFSTLDAPMSQNKDFTLRSILFMSGAEFDIDAKVNPVEVWRRVIFDHNNPNSLFRLAFNARENARSIRNNISSELWEAINKWYLYKKGMNQLNFRASDIYDFYEKNITHIALIKSRVDNTLLHNDLWGFISLGIYVERAHQVIRILRSKISDSIILSNNGANIPLMQYQWTTLLKSLEAFDVHKNYYKGVMSKKNFFELILASERFPRSVIYTAKKIHEHLAKISVHPADYTTVLNNFTADMEGCLAFKEFDDEEVIMNRLTEAYDCITDFHNDLQKLYFQ
jgi:uncharacterized alpha-E superfamily protein